MTRKTSASLKKQHRYQLIQYKKNQKNNLQQRLNHIAHHPLPSHCERDALTFLLLAVTVPGLLLSLLPTTEAVSQSITRETGQKTIASAQATDLAIHMAANASHSFNASHSLPPQSSFRNEVSQLWRHYPAGEYVAFFEKIYECENVGSIPKPIDQRMSVLLRKIHTVLFSSESSEKETRHFVALHNMYKLVLADEIAAHENKIYAYSDQNDPVATEVQIKSFEGMEYILKAYNYPQYSEYYRCIKDELTASYLVSLRKKESLKSIKEKGENILNYYFSQRGFYPDKELDKLYAQYFLYSNEPLKAKDIANFWFLQENSVEDKTDFLILKAKACQQLLQYNEAIKIYESLLRTLPYSHEYGLLALELVNCYREDHRLEEAYDLVSLTLGAINFSTDNLRLSFVIKKTLILLLQRKFEEIGNVLQQPWHLAIIQQHLYPHEKKYLDDFMRFAQEEKNTVFQQAGASVVAVAAVSAIATCGLFSFRKYKKNAGLPHNSYQDKTAYKPARKKYSCYNNKADRTEDVSLALPLASREKNNINISDVPFFKAIQQDSKHPKPEKIEIYTEKYWKFSIAADAMLNVKPYQSGRQQVLSMSWSQYYNLITEVLQEKSLGEKINLSYIGHDTYQFEIALLSTTEKDNIINAIDVKLENIINTQAQEKIFKKNNDQHQDRDRPKLKSQKKKAVKVSQKINSEKKDIVLPLVKVTSVSSVAIPPEPKGSIDWDSLKKSKEKKSARKTEGYKKITEKAVETTDAEFKHNALKSALEKVSASEDAQHYFNLYLALLEYLQILPCKVATDIKNILVHELPAENLLDKNPGILRQELKSLAKNILANQKDILKIKINFSGFVKVHDVSLISRLQAIKLLLENIKYFPGDSNRVAQKYLIFRIGEHVQQIIHCYKNFHIDNQANLFYKELIKLSLPYRNLMSHEADKFQRIKGKTEDVAFVYPIISDPKVRDVAKDLLAKEDAIMIFLNKAIAENSGLMRSCSK